MAAGARATLPCPSSTTPPPSPPLALCRPSTTATEAARRTSIDGAVLHGLPVLSAAGIRSPDTAPGQTRPPPWALSTRHWGRRHGQEEVTQEQPRTQTRPSPWALSSRHWGRRYGQEEVTQEQPPTQTRPEEELLSMDRPRGGQQWTPMGPARETTIAVIPSVVTAVVGFRDNKGSLRVVRLRDWWKLVRAA